MPIWISETISTCPHCNRPNRIVLEVKTRETNMRVCDLCNPGFHREIEAFCEKGKEASTGEKHQGQENHPDG
jgi:hypothetical protein